MAKAKYAEWLEEDGLTKLEAWARDGLTEEQIAHNMGISLSSLSEWKKKHSDILDALKRGKEVVDIAVENALYKRAMGYKFKEVTRELRKNEDGELQMMVTKETIKEVAPDTTAQIFWLKNRKPGEWRDKKELEGNITLNKLEDFI
jgi:transcriptional regulator with XRE-family HTH domain